MKTNFKIIVAEITETKYFSIESDIDVMTNFTSHDWTPAKIQNLIEGVEKSKNKEPDESFDWQNEDVFFRSNKYGVFFIDLMAQRAGQKSEKQDLTLNHNEFIQFLQDFKQLVEENS
ncbi:hypothetical protein HNP38_002024 [Chryseobacterium defluvii]|uniref:Uncharacterized protein n=1 Tax=Chryseobacterium defluvii TaxID=160396 RepID=A0A840KFC8_9FLAO|nr:hypothetical protein [Chryseobacterium defluvii]MBB4806728.1 hypothetical protein [Chryseobacterium defluvii]